MTLPRMGGLYIQSREQMFMQWIFLFHSNHVFLHIVNSISIDIHSMNKVCMCGHVLAYSFLPWDWWSSIHSKSLIPTCPIIRIRISFVIQSILVQYMSQVCALFTSAKTSAASLFVFVNSENELIHAVHVMEPTKYNQVITNDLDWLK